ncbi:50S ribosomal protein L25/general stress protein Ctc [Futiania mangrovi]|uniref:Large ribosomal subunit protein bL25 n=1 Tax=Futiania mangrovi TaxID=2959716 RepID=A0A9J6PG78_9PROT|nr:50S ribosomal protein L25/general stress protein Ctc [Futiania mangrovii]MCP1337486.1 50S ribosomal protein L25/general stress protein Ctc [Futiania mangrovii]
MSNAPIIVAEPRERVGKGAARATRREGKVPAVIYGDKKPPVAIKVNYNELLKTIHRGGFMKTIFEIDVNGEKTQAIARDLQLDPVKDLPLHVDFLRVGKGSKLTVMVPVEFTDEDECPGLRRGGALNIVRHEVEMEVPSSAIPEKLTVSLKGLDIGDSLHISAFTLPKDCTPTIRDRDFTVATIAGAGGSEAAQEEAAEAEGEEE